MNHCRLLVTFLFLLSLAWLSSSTSPAPLPTNGKFLTEDQLIALFIRWMIQNGKSYDKEQFVLRYDIWRYSLSLINEHNDQFLKGNSTFSLSLNKFADWTNEEIQLRNGFVVSQTIPIGTVLTVSSAPMSFDWRNQAAVSPVVDQGYCGSCFSFSAAGAIEGAWAIKHSQLIPLSQQQIIDCSFGYGNGGCYGGLPDNAFQYVRDNGITSADNYPYTGEEGSCSSIVPLVTISSFVDVAFNDEVSLLAAVNKGPVSVGIQANQPSFQYYSGGVFSDVSCGTNLDHAVLIVGYGTDLGLPYWIVKNSWGSGWGEAGYIRMIRNTNSCGIAMLASYPVV